MWGHTEKVAVWKTETKLLPDTEPGGTWLLASRTVKKKKNSVVHATQSVVFCYGSPSRWT